MNKFKLITAIVSIFIIMPTNGYLFSIYDAWFPILLMLFQLPLLIGLLREWYIATSQNRNQRLEDILDDTDRHFEV